MRSRPRPGVLTLSAFMVLCIGSVFGLNTVRSVTIFGATSGVGQLVSKKCLENNVKVNAVTRNVNFAKRFDNNLEGCRFFRADGRDIASLRQEGLFAADAVVISVGTTAFPSAKWEGDKNTPKIACLDVVKNILEAMEQSPASPRPRRVILLSSIGVERSYSFPFKILNSYGVLQYKLESERLLLERAKKARYEAVVVRPGRLVGAPFTNSDLAKLLQLDQGSNKGITVSANDDVAGDMERGDVATAVVRLLDLELPKSALAMGSTVVSIVNKPGRAPTMGEWDALLTAPSAYYDPILL